MGAADRKRSVSPISAMCRDASLPAGTLGQRVHGSSLALLPRTTCLGSREVGSSTASCDSRQLGSGQLSSCSGASGSLSSSLSDSKEPACDINDLRLMLSASLAAQEQQRILQQKSQEQLAECMAVLRASRQELFTVRCGSSECKLTCVGPLLFCRREVEVLRQAQSSREHLEGSLGNAHERSGVRRRSCNGFGSSDEGWRSETPPPKVDHNVAGVAAAHENSPTPSSAVTASPGCNLSSSLTMTPTGQVMMPSSQHSGTLAQNLVWCPVSGGVLQEQQQRWQQQQQIGLAVPPMPLTLRSD